MGQGDVKISSSLESKPAFSLIFFFPQFPFLPAAKPSGPRTVRVVVLVVVWGEQFDSYIFAASYIHFGMGSETQLKQFPSA